MNLGSLTSLSSLATNAFDTARSTFKAMAEAAVPPADAAADTVPGGAAEPAASRSGVGDSAGERTERPAPPQPAKAAGRVDAERKSSMKGGRRGTVLDAYA
ncbi:MAG TPA: hypothetical protein VGD29_00145 [Actinoplanes sp.]|jgi:hypothetical protein